jgi:NADH:ubiquinone oxidoreductase subunit 6 (subunit J)
MEELPPLKQEFRILERNVLILILLPLPFFALVYLYTTSPTRTVQVPELPGFLNPFILSLTIILMAFQQINFQKEIRNIQKTVPEVEEKFRRYAKATIKRYWLLLVVGFICAAGLFFYQNAGFTVAYAVTLIIISIAKPSPDRIIRIFHLKGAERDLIYNINRIEY